MMPDSCMVAALSSSLLFVELQKEKIKYKKDNDDDGLLGA
jgi:hypothetical protein